MPWASSRLENARIDLKIGILTKLTGPHRLVTSPIPLKHSVMVIDIVKKKRKTSKSSKSIRKKSFLYHNFELNRLVTFSSPSTLCRRGPDLGVYILPNLDLTVTLLSDGVCHKILAFLNAESRDLFKYRIFSVKTESPKLFLSL